MADLAGEKVAYLGFCGPIDSAGVSRIAATLNGAVNEQYDRVYLCMTSLGGYVSDGIYLYNHIRSLPVKVTLHNTGTMASIAATLFLAADDRVCSPNAVFMMHPVTFGSNGPMAAQALQANLAAALSDEERTDTILRDRAALPGDILARRRFTELYIPAQDALKFSLVHRVEDFALPAGNQIIQL